MHERGRREREVERYRNVRRHSRLDGRERAYPTGAYDANASGRLRGHAPAERAHIYAGRRSRWADRRVVDARTAPPPPLLRDRGRNRIAAHDAIERRIAAEQAAERARLEAEERERNWHRLMAGANERLIETHRAAHPALRRMPGTKRNACGATAMPQRPGTATAPRRWNGSTGRAATPTAGTRSPTRRRCPNRWTRPRRPRRSISRVTGAPMAPDTALLAGCDLRGRSLESERRPPRRACARASPDAARGLAAISIPEPAKNPCK